MDLIASHIRNQLCLQVGLQSAISCPGPTKAEPGSNLTGSQPHLPDHLQWLAHHNRRTHAAHVGTSLEHKAFVMRADYAAGTHRISKQDPSVYPFAWQSNKAILFYFTQNSVSEIRFGISVQRG